MKLIYDSVSSEYVYLLSKADVGRIKGHVHPDIWDAIKHIRFGLSIKSTRAGRMVKTGKRCYCIRVNFCPRRMEKSLQSPLVCAQKHFLEGVKRYGGKPDLKTRTIDWSLADAKRYCYFVLLHEIGHVVYAEVESPGSIYHRSTRAEEDWCDRYSDRLIKKLGV